MHIFERSPIIKIEVERVSLMNTSPWRATSSDEYDVAWRNRFYLLAHFTSLLLKPWCTMIERDNGTRPAVIPSEPSEAVKGWKNLRCKQNVVFDNDGPIA